jgi:hypothetical protein
MFRHQSQAKNLEIKTLSNDIKRQLNVLFIEAAFPLQPSSQQEV